MTNPETALLFGASLAALLAAGAAWRAKKDNEDRAKEARDLAAHLRRRQQRESEGQ